MTIYLSRAFRRSNSSLFLCTAKAVQSSVLRLNKERFVVDAGLGTARICMQDEPTGVPTKRKRKRATRFENKVGSTDVVGCELRIKKRILVRLFRKIVSGESREKKRAAAYFENTVGSRDVVSGEGRLLLPQRFRQKRAWMELQKIWIMKRKVKGFLLKKKKKSYLIAIAGFITFLPKNHYTRRRLKRVGRLKRAQFTIQSLKRKMGNIVTKKILVFIYKKQPQKRREGFWVGEQST